jgi:AraC-like DNA-binding protein
MTISRHDPDRTILVRTFGVTFGINGSHDLQKIAPPNAPGWDQLIYATRGMMTVHANESCWAVPPHRAIWIPSSLRCRIEMNGEVALRMLYLRTGIRLAQSCAVVNVTPLMRELIVRAVQLGALDSAKPSQKRLYGVIRDELNTLRGVPLQLPLPKDERAARFAVLADSNAPVTTLLRECGASRRTMERLFQDETAMSLGQWLRRQKLLRALRLLAARKSVKQVALELGYCNSSAFIAMFRRELGESPTRYFV